MSNLVIVAIPDENERVWKLSSEKVPHLTLLFLGDMDQVSNLEQIVLFVEHASSLLGRFHLSVDRRGELGADQADVIFFKKNRYEYKAIRDFRAQLLQDNNIKTAHDTATQFEGPWNPHLTLGYPATPAKPDDSDWGGLYSVEFNRIAVWTDDFDGPEFQLKDWWDEYETMDTIPMDVSMSDLGHAGVKGMQWGVRKDRQGRDRFNPSGHSTEGEIARVALLGGTPFGIPAYIRVGKRVGTAVKAKKEVKADAKWEKKVYTVDGDVKVHNAMAEHFNTRISSINDKPEYKDLNLNTHPDNDLAKKYYNDVNKLTMDGNRIAVQQVHGRSPSGKKVAQLSEDGESIKIVDESKVTHAANEEDDVIEILLRRDDNDRIVEMNTAEMAKDAQHSIDLGSDFVLEHFGTKGMRWGVRKDDVASGARAVGSAAKASGGAIGRAAKTTSRFVKDVNFESRVQDEDKRQALRQEVTGVAYKKFKKEDLPAIKNKPEYQSAKKLKNRLRHPRDPITKQYRQEAKTTYINRLEEASNARTNASGSRQYTIRERGNDQPAAGGALPRSKHYWDISARDIQHAAGDVTVSVEVIMDADGFITDLKEVPVAKSLAQTAIDGSDFVLEHFGIEEDTMDAGEAFILEHFGIKGMQWGRRKTAPEAVTPTATSRVPHGTRRKTKIKAEGGENHPAHEDAIKVAQARVKLKKSGHAALSNQELRDLANRIQLENQVSNLTASRGRKFVSSRFQSESERLALEGARKGATSAAPHVVRKVRRGAAVAATTAALV